MIGDLFSPATSICFNFCLFKVMSIYHFQIPNSFSTQIIINAIC